MEIQFQKGEYPIKQVFFVELDSVLGGLMTSGLLKAKYGKVDIVHDIRTSPTQTDLDLLMLTTRPVVSTCWSASHLMSILPAYVRKRGWKREDVRVYELGRKIDYPVTK